MTLNGCVKWFNSKKGYGFITVLTPESEHVGTDVFAHYTHVNVRDNSYKRLFPGEYVSFNMGKNNNRDVCIDITGIGGGRLLADHEEYRFKYFPKNVSQENDESSKESVEASVEVSVEASVEVEDQDQDQDPEVSQ